MGYNFSDEERRVLTTLSSGYTEREACHRLGIESHDLSRIWERVGEEFDTSEVDMGADAQDRDNYRLVVTRRLQSELWASEARLTALIDIAPEAIFVIDGRTGTIIRVNAHALSALGYTRLELIGKPVEMLVPEEKRDIHVAYRVGFLNSVRKREMGYHPLIQAVCKDGSMVHLDIALTATSATDDVLVVCRALPCAPALTVCQLEGSGLA
jgi:PAS domain S-box-containing protein